MISPYLGLLALVVPASIIFYYMRNKNNGDQPIPHPFGPNYQPVEQRPTIVNSDSDSDSISYKGQGEKIEGGSRRRRTKRHKLRKQRKSKKNNKK